MISISIFAMLELAISGQVPRLGGAVHWAANTSGKPDDHIQNFIEDMSVTYVPSLQYPRPLVLTKSFWDEGHAPNAAYYNGARVEHNWWLDSTNSRTARYAGDTCRIENFYGRGFLFKLAEPPQTGDSVPHVACSGGSTIRDVVDPTAITFDRQGRLLVADNGPDQNVKIFRRDGSNWKLDGTFGEIGGVFGGSRPGAVGPRRFWGIRGLGVDSAGNLYVGNTGIPMQTMGGTDIRVFSAEDSSLLWQVQGLAFVNSADFDPESDGSVLYTNAKRFSVDWGKDPGKSWRLEGVTLDPFRYPDDIRLQRPMENTWIRRIGSSKFLFLSTMRAECVAVFRFLPGDEVAVPCAVFNAGGRDPGSWMDSIRPAYDSTQSWMTRWGWIDANGDAKVQKNEFAFYELAYPYVEGIDVDADGSIRMGGRGISRLKCTGVGANGIPKWSFPVAKEAVPFTDGAGDALRLQYFTSMDRMLISGTTAKYPNFLYVIDRWSTSNQATPRKVDLPYVDSGADVVPRLDQNTYDMVLPTGFTSDGRYAYIPFIDRGPDAQCIDVQGSVGAKGSTMKCRGEISVLDLETGKKIGYFAPDSGVGWFSGAFDMYQPLNVTVLSDGRRIVSAEEDGTGKILLYNWCPSGIGLKCDGPDPQAVSRTSQRKWGVRTTSQGLQLFDLPADGWDVRLRDVTGRTVMRTSGETKTVNIVLPSHAGVLLVEVVGHGARKISRH